MHFTSLLAQFDDSELLAYTNETIIAEKFQAMIFLADFNSRMKDFYDVYKLLDANYYNKNVLQNAIIATLKNRNTPYMDDHVLFTDEFKVDEDRNSMWKIYLNKINSKEKLTFEQVMQKIKSEIKPIWEKLNDESF